ncbi:hypothetical protein DSECCO2_590540 [anaerobic digester metagenome]
MGDGDRNARLDLLHEQGQHAPPASQHVAEAHADHLGLLAVEHARHELDHALGRTHDVGRVDRLVGGDDHHLLHCAFLGTLEHRIGAQNVGCDGLLGIELLQRHVLVGGGVEDQLRPVLLHDPVDFPAVLDIAHHRDDQVAPLFLVVVQPQRQIVQLRLIDVQEDELRRAVG